MSGYMVFLSRKQETNSFEKIQGKKAQLQAFEHCNLMLTIQKDKINLECVNSEIFLKREPLDHLK